MQILVSWRLANLILVITALCTFTIKVNLVHKIFTQLQLKALCSQGAIDLYKLRKQII